jgi:2-polyprenyl-3-methyl-5-hydroxy-6-metoxy-1,4-benzoquinol methylase
VSFPAAMETLARLTASAEALAALAARLRADTEGLPLDPEIEQALDGVLASLGVEREGLSGEERATIALYARAFLRQAADLADHPERPPGWGYDDPVVLLSLGRGSASIALAFAAVPELDAALSAPGAALLDVGAGVAALSNACVARWPGLRVVGLEPWPPALALAREEAVDGVELRTTPIEELEDAGVYDVVWIAGPFIAPAVMPAALERSRVALKPGGWVALGLYEAPPDPLAQQLVSLRTIRSGGRALSEAEGVAALTEAGFHEPREVPRTWPSPVRLIVARTE